MKKTVILCILDGWGHSIEKKYNPILLGNTPHWDDLSARCPQSFLEASGEAVGLPAGQMGNSEVGHLNLGAGRIVMQSLPRISHALAGNFLSEKQNFNDALNQLKPDATIHILGLLSEGGVHSHQNHISAIANYVMKNNHACLIHAFTDGRDCPPQSALNFVKKFQHDCRAPIATIAGRYFAMDRDKNWQRTLKAYHAITAGQAEASFTSATDAISASYTHAINDEFIEPAIIGDYQGIKQGDMIIMANFRADRARQIMTLLCDPTSCAQSIDNYQPPETPACLFGMCCYGEYLAGKFQILFEKDSISNTLGEIVSQAQKTQLRLAETEKYAHVTYFFNGGIEPPFPAETRILVPSPKIATYDLQPEMSAARVSETLCEAVLSGDYDLIIVNYANPDMVGHTGNIPAAIKAVEFIDDCIGDLLRAIDMRNKNDTHSIGAELLLTADHGNIEQMVDETTGEPHTAHTCNKVKLTYYGPRKVTLKDGILADIAPCVLNLLELPQPKEMTGQCLLSY